MDVDVYSACDRAIKEMNRQNLVELLPVIGALMLMLSVLFFH